MTTLYYAATAPVNPAGASPVLTAAQVWEGLRLKVRHADRFVPPIRSCVVLGEEDGGRVVRRRVVFEGGREMTEVCTERAPHRVEFRLEDGTEVDNILAPGPAGPADLHLTYAFKWKLSGGGDTDEKGGREESDVLAEQQKMALGAVQSTIKVIRDMVTDGRLNA
ncbi:hypothetical protein IF1G_07861 [Cordyceps javanica]|uniref:DUF1857 domain-containing protein n=1 Tax=Cordyceps javanica TaxID=43265 RepID=A0A545UUY6_9HYPO|nr:hypothetical protein IF1G_07861 [Cordyceps javanica]TQW05358.1 polyketide cyclase / dehydrase and lipid transport domain-containing protein [Cordyceps javanica]